MAKLTPEEQFEALEKALKSMTATITNFVSDFASTASNAAKSMADDVDDLSKEVDTVLKKALKKAGKEDFSKFAEAQMKEFNDNILEVYRKNIGTGALSATKRKKALEEALKSGDVKEKFGFETDFNKKGTEAYTFFNSLLDLVKKFENEILQVNEAVADLSRDMMKPFDKLIGWIEKMPGGKILSSALELDTMKKEIEMNIKAELKKAYDEGVRGFDLVGKAGTSAFKNIGKAIMANPMLLILGAVALIFVGLIKLGNRYLDVMKGIRDQTGLVAKDASELAMLSRDVAEEWSNVGIDMEAAGKATSAIVNEFQLASVATRDMVEGVGTMVGILGVGEQNAAKVARIFTAMGGVSADMVDNMSLVVADIARTGKVAPAKVFEDMAQSSKEINLYFKGNVKEAAKAAIELRRMGSSLKEAATTAKGLVDFESSITSELEASVLLGRQLDLSAARYYAWTGQIEKAQNAVLDQVGNLAEWNRMMPFQKEAIAKAANMEVDQITNMLNQRKLISQMSKEEKEAYQDSLKQLEKIQDVDKDRLIMQNKSLLAQEQLKKMWDNILMALSPILDVLYKITEFVANLIEKTGTWGIGLVVVAGVVGGILLKAATSLMGAMSQKISGGIMDLINKPDVIKKSGEQLEMFGDKTSKFSKGAGGGWGLAKAAVGIILIAGALWIFAQALKVLADNDKLWESLAAAAVGLLVLAGIAILLASFAPVFTTGVFVIMLLAVAVGILGLALQAFIPVMEAFGKLFTVFTEAIGKLATQVTFEQLAGVAGGLTLIGLSLAAFGMTGIFGMFGLLQLLGTTAALKELAMLASPLNVVATSIERLGEALKVLNSVSIDVDKLEDISDIAVKVKRNESPNVNVAAADNSGIIKKLDEMIKRIESMEIKMDGKIVGEIVTEKSGRTGFGQTL